MSDIISLKEKNNDHITEGYLNEALHIIDIDKFEKVAQDSLVDFILASPNEKIASGWSYEIISDKKKVSLFFNNSNVQNGENIAILIDVGHGTVDGKWISGENYLSGPIEKAYKRLLDITWRTLKNYG